MTEDMHYGNDYKKIPATSKESGKVERIAEGVWYHTIQIVNVSYVRVPDSDQWVLTDAGMPDSAKEIIQTAEEVFGENVPPAAIVLTHGHFDHVGAIVELVEHWNIPIYAHKEEIPYLRGEKAYVEPDSSVEGGAVAKVSRLFPKEPIQLGDVVKPLPEDGSVPFLEEWEWVHTPGHTPGHVSFLRREDGTLLAGDAFVTVHQENLYDVMVQKKEISGPPRYFTPDWKQSRLSVEKLRDLQPKTAVTGHGKPMQGDELATNLRYLAEHFNEIAVPAHGKYVDD